MIKNAKFSGYCFYINTSIYGDFEINIRVHLSCFVDFILCPTGKYMFKVNNEKIRLICWMCFKVKVNTAWHHSGVLIVDFDNSQ